MCTWRIPVGTDPEPVGAGGVAALNAGDLGDLEEPVVDALGLGGPVVVERELPGRLVGLGHQRGVEPVGRLVVGVERQPALWRRLPAVNAVGAEVDVDDPVGQAGGPQRPDLAADPGDAGHDEQRLAVETWLG